MTPERWRQIEEVCQQALACEGDARAHYLDEACGQDEELRREVESLIAEGPRLDPLLGTPPWEAAAREFAAHGAPGGSLEPGRCLGPFLIEALIGSGGMGEVYRARDTRLGRTVALKMLLPESGGDADHRQRLKVEARAASALSHPHICTLLDIRSDDGIDYLVMEHLVGETLAARLERRGAFGTGPALDLPEALEIGAQIADALAAAHQHGILHRDLKPGNVMLTRDGVKLLDFGLAKFKPSFAGMAVSDAGDAAPHTVPGSVLGTVHYMSPEQLNGGEPDARSDLFAFGAVLYEMVAGRRAFEGTTPASVIASILEREPRLLSEWQPLAPAALAHLVRECLAKDPDTRWDSARLAAEELRRIASSLDGEDRDADGSGMSRVRWPRIWPAAVTAAAVVTLAVVAWSVVSKGAPTAPLQRLPLDLGVTFALTPRLVGVAISPDGRRLAFHGTDAAGRGGLFTRLVDQAAPTRLLPRPLHYPVFSPDGRWLAGFTDGKLVTVNVADGTLVEICPSFVPRGVAWADDRTLVAALGPSEGLVVVGAIPGGAPSPLTRLDAARGELTHRWPYCWPGTGVVTFTVTDSSGDYDDARIEAISLSNRRRAVVHRGGYGGRYLPTGHVVFARHDVLLAVPVDLERLTATGPAVPVLDAILGDPFLGRLEFSASRSGAGLALTGFWRYSREQPAWVSPTGESEPLPLAEDTYADPRVSPDGRRIVMGVWQGSSRQLLVLDQRVGTPTRLISRTTDLTAVWAPDGEHLVYAAESDLGVPNLFWRRADGKGPVTRLTRTRHIQYPSSFSPDGSHLAFGEASPTRAGDIWLLPLDLRDADAPIAGDPQPFATTTVSEEQPAFSPDGRWLAYQVSPSGRGPYEIHVARVANPAEQWLVATNATTPLWSRDGKRLLFEQDRNLMMVDVAIRRGVPQFGRPRRWGNAPGFVHKFDCIRAFDLTPNPASILQLLPVPRTPSDRPPPAVTLLVNFFDEVRRRTAAGR